MSGCGTGIYYYLHTPVKGQSTKNFQIQKSRLCLLKGEGVKTNLLKLPKFLDKSLFISNCTHHIISDYKTKIYVMNPQATFKHGPVS